MFCFYGYLFIYFNLTILPKELCIFFRPKDSILKPAFVNLAVEVCQQVWIVVVPRVFFW